MLCCSSTPGGRNRLCRGTLSQWTLLVSSQTMRMSADGSCGRGSCGEAACLHDSALLSLFQCNRLPVQQVLSMCDHLHVFNYPRRVINHCTSAYACLPSAFYICQATALICPNFMWIEDSNSDLAHAKKSLVLLRHLNGHQRDADTLGSETPALLLGSRSTTILRMEASEPYVVTCSIHQ